MLGDGVDGYTCTRVWHNEHRDFLFLFLSCFNYFRFMCERSWGDLGKGHHTSLRLERSTTYIYIGSTCCLPCDFHFDVYPTPRNLRRFNAVSTIPFPSGTGSSGQNRKIHYSRTDSRDRLVREVSSGIPKNRIDEPQLIYIPRNHTNQTVVVKSVKGRPRVANERDNLRRFQHRTPFL